MDAAATGSIGRGAGQEPHRRLLTLGDCTANEIGKKLGWAYDHTHIWDATWPSMIGSPVRLRRQPSGPAFEAVRDFIQRECNKSVRGAVEQGGYDVIVTSIAHQILTPFAVIGQSCIPDFTNERFWSIRHGEMGRTSVLDFLGPGAAIADWTQPDFVAFLKAGFERCHREVFAPLIKRGTIVVLYHHRLTRQAITAAGIVPEPHAEFLRRAALIDEIGAWAARLDGVSVISTVPDLNYTSSDAAGGRWAFHPIDEQYVQLAAEVAALAGNDLGGEIVRRHMLQSREMAARRAEENRMNQSELANEVARLRDRERDLVAVSQSLAYKAARIEVELTATRRTVSWRMTRPLRVVRGLFRFGRRSHKMKVAKAP